MDNNVLIKCIKIADSLQKIQQEIQMIMASEYGNSVDYKDYDDFNKLVDARDHANVSEMNMRRLPMGKIKENIIGK